ncbi:MAG: pilin [Patescibacteria group bacterium]
MKKISLIISALASLITIHSVSAATWGLEILEGTGLPNEAPGAFIARIVSYVLGFIGILLIVMIIYGGLLYMTSRGNEKQTETAKNVLTYAIIGVVIIFAAYIIARVVISALTTGATQTPSTPSGQQIQVTPSQVSPER